MFTLSCLTKKNQNLSFQAANHLKTQLSVLIELFFPWVQILIFLHKATQGDHISLLYEFEMFTKFYGCVGSFKYVPPSVRT